MSIDSIFIEFVHKLYELAGPFFTPLFRIISILGEKCWFFLLIAFYLVLRKKTRWIGLTAILAVFIGFIFADILLKPTIMRERPYLASVVFQKYWELVGSYKETGYSMPSGHCIGITAFFVSLYITVPKNNRKTISSIGFVSVICMVLSRCYFMHHYFSDCIVGIIIGAVVSYLSKALVRLIHMFCKKMEDITLFNFILNFDIDSQKKDIA